jgi:putative CocE/NonD family hydrolase
MTDGTVLAARIHELADDDAPRPALVEYSPYRSDDLALAWFGRFWDALALAGFRVVRIDVRGTGSSEGVVSDEYTAIETADGAQAVEWLARQEWCSGRVGMFGISYSGFTALQVAALRPEGLGAIAAVSATDDRYADDVHYGGGAMRLQENVIWYGPWMAALNALPPHPNHCDGWEAVWKARLDAAEPWMFRWLEHPKDGPYWRVGSVRGFEDRIACPAFIVSGWQDGYRNSTLRLFERLSVPKRCLIGPWAHFWPDEGVPGPAVAFTTEVASWFRQWLLDAAPSDQRNEITVFIQEALRPEIDATGTWYRSETAASTESRWSGFEGTLLYNQARSGTDTLRIVPSAGAWAIPWGGMPWIRWPDDQTSWPPTGVAYTCDPLDRDIVLLGRPRLETTILPRTPASNLSVRLVDAAPDGSNTLVTTGVVAIAPSDRQNEISVELDATAWCFRERHRIRIILDGGDWPNTLPSPALGTIRFHSTTLVLPEIDVGSWTPVELEPPRNLPEPRCEIVTSPYEWRVLRDTISGTWEVTTGYGMDALFEDGRFVWEVEALCSLDEFKPETAAVSSVNRVRREHADLTVEATAKLVMIGEETSLRVQLVLDVVRDGRTEAHRHWSRSFPRGSS